ncbi:hypothetical protein BRADI_2g41648v3 [Brachypodium distachyon]|uniref:Uncharacterized protein n=1 Tax=Brachypodium distachyon TaxID=15368 RepID=A0A2K2DD77_BRADI|nr:hypothetical protein BRADI_2g41648v3 [Brachypodium distachyon]
MGELLMKQAMRANYRDEASIAEQPGRGPRLHGHPSTYVINIILPPGPACEKDRLSNHTAHGSNLKDADMPSAKVPAESFITHYSL